MEHGGFTTHPDDPGQPGAGRSPLLVDVLDRPPAGWMVRPTMRWSG
jgi:hypothetical protein